MNKYYENLKFVKQKTEEYLCEIFKVYGNELILRLEEYNLLTHPDNCIKTSTATGFIMEEFIVSKLETYTYTHNGINEIKIQRMNDKPTVGSGYDCLVTYDGIYVMINVKVQKKVPRTMPLRQSISCITTMFAKTPSKKKHIWYLKYFTISDYRKLIIQGR